MVLPAAGSPLPCLRISKAVYSQKTWPICWLQTLQSVNKVNIAKLGKQLVAVATKCPAKITETYFQGAEQLTVSSSLRGGQNRSFIFATFCFKLLAEFPKRKKIPHCLPMWLKKF